MVTLALLGCIVFTFALVARRLEGTVITAPMVFVCAGLLGASTGLVDFGTPSHGESGSHSPTGVVLVAAELALVLLLFSGAARIDPRALRGDPLPGRLLLVGLPLTILLGTVVAVLVLPGLSLWECAIVAAILAPTDAALGMAVVANERLSARLRQGLSVESGLNDGGSVPFLTLFIALAAAEEGLQGSWMRFAAEQIGYGMLIGAAVGGAGGFALRRASERGFTVPLFERLAFAALAVMSYAAADQLGGNGFIAAFVGGGAAGLTARSIAQRADEFAEEQGELLNLAIFTILGGFAYDALPEATWPMVAYAALSLTLIRMLPVAIATIGLKLAPRTVAFVGWFGPRGLASIILALVVFEDAPALEGLHDIFVVMVVTVMFSVFAHGITAAPLSTRLADSERELAGPDAVAPAPTERADRERNLRVPPERSSGRGDPE